MTPFSTKDFASLLDEVLATDAGEERAAGSRPSIPFDVLLERQTIDPPTTFHDPEIAAEYLFAAADNFAVEPDLGLLAPPPSTAPFDIAQELGLTGREAPEALDRIRREFAFANHPDRVAEDLRDIAITRMQIANRMIDDAKERCAKIAAVR